MNKYIPPPQEPEHDHSYIPVPKWLAKRIDIKPEDKLVLALILMLQNNPKNPIRGKSFISQRNMGEVLGMSRKAVNLSLARLNKEDKGRRTSRHQIKETSHYKYRFIEKTRAEHPNTNKLLTVFRASLDKDSPLWWVREESEGRCGFKDVRSKKNHDFEPKQPNIIEFKKARKSS